jgi:hypothetical protein
MMIAPAKRLLFGYLLLVALLLSASEQQKPVGRVLEQETSTAVMRNYLQAWQGLGEALSQNHPAALDDYFVGIAKSKFQDTLREQQQLGIRVIYRNQTHDPQIVFYSPDGLSVQLLDNVAYLVEVRDHGRIVGSQEVHSRYVAVMTPTETKWKVRILQVASP